jgi:hypothetical protein
LTIQPWFWTEITFSAFTANPAMTSGDVSVAARYSLAQSLGCPQELDQRNSNRPVATRTARAVPIVASTAIQDANDAPINAAVRAQQCTAGVPEAPRRPRIAGLDVERSPIGCRVVKVPLRVCTITFLGIPICLP